LNKKKSIITDTPPIKMANAHFEKSPLVGDVLNVNDDFYVFDVDKVKDCGTGVQFDIGAPTYRLFVMPNYSRPLSSTFLSMLFDGQRGLCIEWETYSMTFGKYIPNPADRMRCGNIELTKYKDEVKLIMQLRRQLAGIEPICPEMAQRFAQAIITLAENKRF
jgi:hypothetical protein